MKKRKKNSKSKQGKLNRAAEAISQKKLREAFKHRGRKNRASGARFELKVRNELESQGWIMDKWTNNVDLEEGKLVKAKRKYNPFKKMLIVGTGFPDFIGFKKTSKKSYEVIGIEVKRKGILSKTEKEKCAWYLQKGIFSQIRIAKAVRKGRFINIEYIDFKEKYGDKS